MTFAHFSYINVQIDFCFEIQFAPLLAQVRLRPLSTIQ